MRMQHKSSLLSSKNLHALRVSQNMSAYIRCVFPNQVKCAAKPKYSSAQIRIESVDQAAVALEVLLALGTLATRFI